MNGKQLPGVKFNTVINPFICRFLQVEGDTSSEHNVPQRTTLKYCMRKNKFCVVVISKNFSNGALDKITPIAWVWPSYSHAHFFRDKNMNVGLILILYNQ